MDVVEPEEDRRKTHQETDFKRETKRPTEGCIDYRPVQHHSLPTISNSGRKQDRARDENESRLDIP